ncbi:MAG: hypothetical protein RLW62_19695 [Gammaproteobacteria bacterium]
MAARKADWRMLRGTLIGFVVCLLLAAGMLSASLYFRNSMEREYQGNHQRFRGASQLYLAVDEEERIIEEFYPQFVRHYRAGLIGGERRLSWLETLRTAAATIRVPELSYKLDARAPWAQAPALALGGYELHASTMHLSLGLLHEGDLLALFAALEAEALGQFTVSDCELVAGETALTLDPQAVNVRAECRLDWLTVDLAGEQELAL